MKNGISICCTIYNDEKEIIALLDDISNQTMLPNEIIIADGGSTDKSIELIEGYKANNDIKIILLKGKRLNISEGLNEAIKNSSCDCIVIMAVGNRYDEKFVYSLKSKMSDEVDYVYAAIRGQDNNSFQELYNRGFLNGKRGKQIPSNHGILIKRNVFKEIGLFYEKFVYAGEDAEFYNRLAKNRQNGIYANDAILYWDVPKNIEELKGLIRSYTKAELQIKGFRETLMGNKIIISTIIILTIALLMLINGFLYFALSFFAIPIILLAARFMKNGIRISFLRLFYSWYKLIFTVRYNELSKKKYRVDGRIITYLEE